MRKILNKSLVIIFVFLSFFLLMSFNGIEKVSATNGDTTTAEAKGGMIRPDFMIPASDIYPGVKADKKNTKDIANWILGNIIQVMMIALGTLSVFVMVIGAGYMILHNGQEDLLSRGKTIFMGGIYSMIIALCSYYLIEAVKLLLFTNT